MANFELKTAKGRGKKVYISGPMTGMPDLNYPLFDAKEDLLFELGYMPVNPANNFNRAKGHSRSDYLKLDLQKLLFCDYIYFLPGFEQSAGALLEALVARECGIPVLAIEA